MGRGLDAPARSDALWQRALSAAFEISAPQAQQAGESLQGFAFQTIATTRRRIDRERELYRHLTELRNENEVLRAQQA